MLNLNIGALLNRIFPEITDNNSLQNHKASVLQVLLQCAALVGLTYIIQNLNILPTAGIPDIAGIFIPGFFIYSFLPNRYRPFFYCLIFAACTIYVLSWLTALLIVSTLAFTAFVLFSNIAWRLKLLYLIILFAGLIVVNRFYMPRANIAATYIAAILMFRVIVLMYELKYARLKDNRWLQLSYFLCFPNLSFLFFPIIDYRTYMRSYYADSYGVVCRRAMWFIMLAVGELLLYKLITHYLNPTVASIHDAYTLIAFCLSHYLLVIKMVGILTMGVGLMMMFGFSMPAPFGNFLLAFSFSEYWQKVNAYWRAFVLKIIYYPFYFKYRKKLKRNAVTLGIIIAFLASYVLHSYQKFWIAGSFSFQLTDLLYWMLLGLLVMWNYRRNEGKDPKAKKDVSLKACIINGLNYVIVLVVMILLWNLWNSETFSYFVFIMRKGLHATPGQLLVISGALLTIIIIAAIYSFYHYSSEVKLNRWVTAQSSYSYGTLGILCLLVALKPETGPMGDAYAIVAAKESVNKDEAERREAGYYESIISTKNEDWEVGANNLNRHSFVDASTIPSNDLLLHTLKPGIEMTVETPTKTRSSYLIKTNRYGMRDREYTLEKPAGTYRIAILGGSYEMGTGVNNEQVFEAIAENKLNEYYKGSPKVELMNFGVWGYTLVQEMEQMRDRVPQFHPDAIMVFSHTDEYEHGARNFTRYIRNGIPLKYEFLQDIKRRSGVRQTMNEVEIKSRVKPYMRSLYQWCYHAIDSMCRANNIRPIWVFLPVTNQSTTPADVAEYARQARSEGFETLDLYGVFNNMPVSKVAISDFDNHPTPLGHELIANKLFNLLTDSTTHIIPLK